MTVGVDYVARSPRGALVIRGRAAGNSSMYPTATLSRGVVWLGGPDDVTCADANTGRVRATAVVHPRNDSPVRLLNSVAASGRRVVGLESPSSHGGAHFRLTATALCFG